MELKSQKYTPLLLGREVETKISKVYTPAFGREIGSSWMLELFKSRKYIPLQVEMLELDNSRKYTTPASGMRGWNWLTQETIHPS